MEPKAITKTPGPIKTCKRISGEKIILPKLNQGQMGNSCLGICIDNIKIHLYLNCRAHTSFNSSLPGIKTHETMLTSVHFAADYNASVPSRGKVAATFIKYRQSTLPAESTNKLIHRRIKYQTLYMLSRMDLTSY